jgi:multiple sugar transport system substrate-binding protein
LGQEIGLKFQEEIEMNKHILIIALLAVILAVVAACAPAPTPAPTAAPPTAAPKPAEPTKAPVAEPTKPPAPTAAPTVAPTVAPQPLVFLSTQLKPVEEAEKMRKSILAGFTAAKVEFVADDEGPFQDRILAEQKAGKVTVGVIGALHGTFPVLAEANALEDLTPLLEKLKDRPLVQEFVTLGKLGTNKQYYIPWMQATYVLAVNKQALQYLPQGADVNALTYKQLAEWGANIQKATGQKKLGIPAGPKSLLHRFIQGYLYPSYTGGLVTTYKTTEAVEMWKEFKALWEYVNPQCTTVDFMQEALLSGEVWVGFDHTARLINAFKEKPDDFIAIPAPAGPKGRYYMSVVAGLGIAKNTPNKAGAEALIEYLTRPNVQALTLREVSFFPVLAADLPADLPMPIKLEASGVIAQSKAKDARVALLPIGLGAKGGEFNKVQLDTFTRIILKGEDIQKVLAEEGANLQKVMNEAKAPCWLPDPPSTGPCQVK